MYSLKQCSPRQRNIGAAAQQRNGEEDPSGSDGDFEKKRRSEMNAGDGEGESRQRRQMRSSLNFTS